MVRSFVGVFAVGFCLVLLGGGCAAPMAKIQAVVSHTDTSATATQRGVLTWNMQGKGIERASVDFATSTVSTIVLYRFSLKDHVFSLAHASSAASVSEWMKQTPQALFVSNGVYFHEDQLPSGAFISGKQRIGNRAFDGDKSALLMLQPRVSILTTPDSQKRAEREAIEAAQSFPVLVSNGRAQIKTDSGKVSRRTFVGIDQAHTYLYVGIVPYTGISLYELGRALAELPIPWETALNVDGGPSSGISFRSSEKTELIDSYVTVPNVLIVEPRP